MNAFKAQKILGDEELPIVKVWIEERKGSAIDVLDEGGVHVRVLRHRVHWPE